MSLPPKSDIGSEIHPHITQFFRIESGDGLAEVVAKDNLTYMVLTDGIALTIPAGVRHNIINVSSTTSLKLYTIYTPPQHPPGTIHRVKPKDD